MGRSTRRRRGKIFIRQALVEGEYRTDAPYFRHNRALLREVALVEAKLRRHDLLVDAESRFAFYAARIPAGIYNGPLFEKWRRNAEARDRRVLFMKREDLIVSGAASPAAPAELFPDAMVIPEMGDLRLPLTYRHDPGHESDGVTVTVPLAALNQLPWQRFEWLVPGWLEEKTAALDQDAAQGPARPLHPRPRYRQGDRPAAAFWRGRSHCLHRLAAWPAQRDPRPARRLAAGGAAGLAADEFRDRR